jgi:hypothetical protein
MAKIIRIEPGINNNGENKQSESCNGVKAASVAIISMAYRK